MAGGEEQDWPPTAPRGRPGPRVLQGFLGTPACDGALSSDACARLSIPRAISCMLEIWLDYYRDDFCQLPEFPSLMKLLQFLRQHMPGSDVELHVRCYLQQLRRLHAVEPEAGGGRAGDVLAPRIRLPCIWVGNRGLAHTHPTDCRLGTPPRALALTHIERWEEWP